MATPIEYVDKQWKEWSEKNPPSTFKHIDKEELVKVLTEDLTYASQMDVREYTLYQKWCEVKERYPVQ
jgi:ribosomal protein S19E (S16A)